MPNPNRHATRRLEPGTARDFMRSYDVTFEALEGEVPEPGDVPAVPVIPPVA